MNTMLRRMRQKRVNGDNGFTMIELLVAVVIIGVLAAIAIPLYMNYRKGALNKSAMSDVRGAITAVEQYYTENNAYPAAAASATYPTNMLFGTQTATLSSGNTLKYAYSVANRNYWLCGQNSDGQAVYVYNSNGSGVKTSTNTLAVCATTGA